MRSLGSSVTHVLSVSVGFSLGTLAFYRRPKTCFGLNPKLLVCVNQSVNGCLSLSIRPAIHW